MLSNFSFVILNTPCKSFRFFLLSDLMQLPPTFTKNYIAVLMGLVEENIKSIYVIELDTSNLLENYFINDLSLLKIYKYNVISFSYVHNDSFFWSWNICFFLEYDIWNVKMSLRAANCIITSCFSTQFCLLRLMYKLFIFRVLCFDAVGMFCQ